MTVMTRENTGTSATWIDGDVDYLGIEDARRRRAVALRSLLLHASAHPLTGNRLIDISAEDIAQADPHCVLARIAPVASPDHTDAILGTASYRPFGTPIVEGSGIVFSTGGTTGRPTMLLNTYAETLRNACHHGKGYWAAGIRPHHRVASFGGSGTYASEYCVYHALAQTGCTIVPINDFRRDKANIAILEELAVDTLLVMPSEAYGLLDHLEAAGETLQSIRLVVTGGEPLSEQVKRRMRSVFSDDLVFGSTFQTADVGTVGYECRNCGPREYHLHAALIHAEIERIDGAPELVLTNLDRRLMPVVRLRTGDRAEWVNLPADRCRCGRTSRRIRLLGRTRDLIKIGGEKIPIDAIRRLPEVLDIAEHRLRIEVSTGDDGRDLITVLCDEVIDRHLQDAACREISEEPKLMQMLAEGRCQAIAFARLPDADMARQGGVKHRALVDRRV